MWTNILDWFLNITKPIIVWWGHLHFPWTKKKITGDHYYLWRDQINPGMVLLATTYGEFSNLINPAKIKHGALYRGGDIIKYVVEAVGKGVIETNLVTFMTTKDVFVVIRPKFGTPEQINQVIEMAKTVEGRPYDYGFKTGNNAFYCYELLAWSFLQIFPDLPIKTHEFLKGRIGYDHRTFMEDPTLWEVVIDSRKLLQ